MSMKREKRRFHVHGSTFQAGERRWSQKDEERGAPSLERSFRLSRLIMQGLSAIISHRVSMGNRQEMRTVRPMSIRPVGRCW